MLIQIASDFFDQTISDFHSPIRSPTFCISSHFQGAVQLGPGAPLPFLPILVEVRVDRKRQSEYGL